MLDRERYCHVIYIASHKPITILLQLGNSLHPTFLSIHVYLLPTHIYYRRIYLARNCVNCCTENRMHMPTCIYLYENEMSVAFCFPSKTAVASYQSAPFEASRQYQKTDANLLLSCQVLETNACMKKMVFVSECMSYIYIRH